MKESDDLGGERERGGREGGEGARGRSERMRRELTFSDRMCP